MTAEIKGQISSCDICKKCCSQQAKEHPILHEVSKFSLQKHVADLLKGKGKTYLIFFIFTAKF